MQCPYVNRPTIESVESREERRSIPFRTHFLGSMEMYADANTVATYLDDHTGWFCHCAEPMKTVPFGDNGYIMTVGKYGAFGYEVEPKLAVILDPPVDGVYITRSVPIPDEPYLGYEVDYRAVMKLEEIPIDRAIGEARELFRKRGLEVPPTITRVTWSLEMDVTVSFPKFIYKISRAILQKTGDKLLSSIVRQVSPRLTNKVQQDFHKRYGLPLPPVEGRTLERVNEPVENAA